MYTSVCIMHICVAVGGGRFNGRANEMCLLSQGIAFDNLNYSTILDL